MIAIIYRQASIMRTVLLLLLMLSMIGLNNVVYSQSQDCSSITIDVLGSTTNLAPTGLISQVLSPGGTTVTPNVIVLDMNIVCEAQASMQDLYRFTSVVATFRCSFTDNRVPDCLNSTVILTQQFDFGCSGGAWSRNILGESSGHTQNPTASLSTPADRDCFLCINPNSSAASLSSLVVTSDTHCEKCANCSLPNTIQRCYGSVQQTCCNYFSQNGTCIESCPGVLVLTTTLRCGCPLLNDPNGVFTYSDNQNVGSIANLTCNNGFVQPASEPTSVMCTVSIGWTAQLSCEQPILCGTGCIVGIIIAILVVIAIIVIVIILVMYFILKKKKSIPTPVPDGSDEKL